MKTILDLNVGESGVITKIGVKGALRQHFMDMGITKGTELRVVKIAPLGDPIEIELRSYNLSIRKADAEQISVE